MISILFIKNKFRFNKISLGILKNQDGASAILVAIVAAILLGFTALAVDVGYMYSTRNEMQNVADAAALAGAGELGRIYLSMGSTVVNGVTLTSTQQGQINDAAIAVALENKGAGKTVDILESDIIISIWDWDSGPDQDLTENLTESDAVRVIARRDSSTASGAVTTFFGRIFSFFGGNADTFNVSAVATAALSGPSIMMEGELNTPFGLSELNFPDNCGERVFFQDTSDSCAGWHNFFEADNANTIRNNQFDIIAGDVVDDEIVINIPDDELDNGFDNYDNGVNWLTYYFGMTATANPTPDTETGDEFNFIGGVGPFMGSVYLQWVDTPGETWVAPVQEDGSFKSYGGEKDVWTGDTEGSGLNAPFPAMFDYFRMRDGDEDWVDEDGNPILDDEGNPYKANNIWTATVPVYEDGDTCSNPSGATKIVGFAVIKILGWRGSPYNDIDVYIDCNSIVYNEARGGGGNFGKLKGSIPNLVQ